MPSDATLRDYASDVTRGPTGPGSGKVAGNIRIDLESGGNEFGIKVDLFTGGFLLLSLLHVPSRGLVNRVT